MKKDVSVLAELSAVQCVVVVAKSTVKLKTKRKVRYRCPECKKTFIRKKFLPITWKEFADFYRLITGKTNRLFMLDKKGIGRSKLSFQFKVFFDLPLSAEVVWNLLPPKLLSSNLDWVYDTDGKWLRRNGVLINHRDVTIGENLWWSYHKSESYEAYHQDLSKLSYLLGDNYLPSGAVSDWNGGGVAGVASHFRPIPHQRCLIYVLRTLKRLLPKNSPMIKTRKLRSIAKEIIHLKDETDVWNWQSKLIDWHNGYGKLLIIRTKGVGAKKKWEYTHGNLRRSWKLLTKDQDRFFIYLDHPLVPKDINSLEGVNSQLKQKLGDHWGMKHPQQVSFAFWYFTFSRVKKLPDLKKLWVGWKKTYNSRN